MLRILHQFGNYESHMFQTFQSKLQTKGYAILVEDSKLSRFYSMQMLRNKDQLRFGLGAYRESDLFHSNLDFLQLPWFAGNQRPGIPSWCPTAPCPILSMVHDGHSQRYIIGR